MLSGFLSFVNEDGEELVLATIGRLSFRR